MITLTWNVKNLQSVPPYLFLCSPVCSKKGELTIIFYILELHYKSRDA